MNKIRVIIGKEWADVFKNKIVFFTSLLVPLVFVVLPIITLAFTPEEDMLATTPATDQLPEFMVAACANLTELQCVEALMLDIYTMLFMIVPVIIPVSIAAYSIVGEKNSRSLEPLLATPISTQELILGKMLAAVIPAVLISWFAYGVYVLLVYQLVAPIVWGRVIAPIWLGAIFIIGPLLSILGVSSAMIVSSRVSDPRAAEQLSAFVIIPLILMIVGQSTGLFLISGRLIVLFGIIVFLLDLITLYFAIQTFQREHILTEWK